MYKNGERAKNSRFNVELDSLIGGNTPGDVTSLNCDLGPCPVSATFSNNFQHARKNGVMKKACIMFGSLA